MSLETVDVILARRVAEVAARPPRPDPRAHIVEVDQSRHLQLAGAVPPPTARRPVTEPTPETSWTGDLPTIRDLPDVLADADVVTVLAMQAIDGRSSAAKFYAKRLAELEG